MLYSTYLLTYLLTPILAKVVESIVLKWVDNIIIPQIDDKQFGGMAGTGTTDALVEMLHKWYEATDAPGSVATGYHCESVVPGL